MTQQRPRRRSARTVLVVLALALALVAAACGGSKDSGGGGSTPTTGVSGGGDGYQKVSADNCDTDPTGVTVTGDTITLGTSIPQSGLYSPFKEILLGEQAYIDYVNAEKGGFDLAGKKYKVKLVAKDDAYEASRTVTNVQSLITADDVFALFDVVGTKNNLAIRDNVNDAEDVIQLEPLLRDVEHLHEERSIDRTRGERADGMHHVRSGAHQIGRAHV